MNSAQRRAARREFPHTVTLKAQGFERYIDHDTKVEQCRSWCQRQFGQGSWRATELYDHTTFYFAKEKDATYFALKWS